MKDPAFLFYTKDFQSGTQDMSCEEVGAYLRLLMYQHQNGFIPHDEERMMRITGIFSVEKFKMVWQMVNHKFIVMDNHLVNQRMSETLTERSAAKPKKIASATLAGLISANKTLTPLQKHELKKLFSINDFLSENEEEVKSKVREWFNNMVNQMVNNLANGNGDAIGNGNANEGKGGMGEKPKKQPKPKADPEPEVIMPFETETFKAQWQVWKVFRKKEHSFEYKTTISEQAALKELSEFAEGNEKTAIAIIHQSIAKGWKGFFELKNQPHGTGQQQNTGNSKTKYSADFLSKIAEGLQSG